MVASYDARRSCPYCGNRIDLADCLIVATNEDAAADLRDAINAAEWRPPPETEPQVRSRIDGATRSVLFPPPRLTDPVTPEQRGRIRQLISPAAEAILTDPRELEADLPVFGLDARRACSTCRHPLPLEIDDRETATVVVAGIVAASKSTFMTRVFDDGRSGGSAPMGFSEFVELEGSSDELDDLADQMDAGDRLAGTDGVERGQYKPWIFAVSGSRDRRPRLLIAHNVAGESFEKPGHRSRFAPFLKWADAIIFLVDPLPFMTPAAGRENGGARKPANQARILDGVVKARLNADRPIVVGLAKADRLGLTGYEAVQSTSEQVAERLHAIGAGAIVTAAPPGSTFHYVAAHPEDGSAPFGAAELFRAAVDASRLG